MHIAQSLCSGCSLPRYHRVVRRQGARNEIFALNPAPVQTSYMGFPATTGADFLPYLITDKVLVPAFCAVSLLKFPVRRSSLQRGTVLRNLIQ